MSNVITKSKSLAQLKKDAAAGRIRLEIVYRFGKTGDDIPDRLRGVRRITRTNSVAIFLKRLDSGGDSELRLKRASLIRYTGDTLIIYAPAEREPNAQEKTVLDGWNKLQKELEVKYPFSDLFWQKKKYFKDSHCSYMSGFEDSEKNGKSYNPSTGKVRDKNIPGAEIIRYMVHHNTGM